MTYNEVTRLLDALAERFRKAGMNPWYRWTTATPWTWEKVERMWEALNEQH